MTKQKILFLKGLIGSGKTTFATKYCEENPDFKRVNKDTIREELGNPSWSREFEKRVLNTAHYKVDNFLDEGFSVIIDDTNFAEKHKEYYQKLAKNRGIEFEEKFIDTPLEECIKRDSMREKPVGEAIIRKMYKDYLKPSDIKTDNRFILKQDKSLPRCTIVDVDGTIALINGRSPYDDSKINTDLPNENVINLVGVMKSEYLSSKRKNGQIIIVSGRMDKCKDQTIKWLQDNNVPFDQIHMRKTNDYRPDDIVKEEIYREFIEGKYYVDFILDDRDSVIKRWRELGLTCLQVYYGNF